MLLESLKLGSDTVRFKLCKDCCRLQWGEQTVGTREEAGRPVRTVALTGAYSPRLRGCLAVSADIFCCHNLEEGGCYWHLAGRGQGCCSTSHIAQDSPPPQQKVMQPQVSVVRRLRSCELGGCCLGPSKR